MNVLFASAEAVPFAKVGGMADVVGSLPAALRKMGIDARVVMPGYGLISHQEYNISHLFTFSTTLHTGTVQVRVYTTVYDGVPFYFIQAWPYFGDDMDVYTERGWDVPRFIFFNQVVMACMWELRQRLDWFPDVLHVNDWHTGLLPFLIHQNRHLTPWNQVATALTIHNLAYQGDNAGGWLWEAGIPGRDHPELLGRGLQDNLMAIAIAYADVVTTVSPRYATEIQYPYMGYGLDGLISTRVADLYGILNGIDADLWNPATDRKLVQNYDASDFAEKRVVNKRHLQELTGLPINDEIMLIGIVSRLVWQKGIDLIAPAMRRLLIDTNVQFVVLGTGEPDLEYLMWRLGQDFHWRARVFLQYNAAVAQHIYAGSDLFLMPSHFEPCGMGQMLAMRYGALPLVRETGGLADTVENYDNGSGDWGTGFVFSWEEPDALLGTLRWAYNTYRKNPEAWRKMQWRAMHKDFSWETSAKHYIDLYEKVHQLRKVGTYES
ncbi:MAG: glycogen synthase GlgA [Anaerolineae bacterium]